MATDRQNARARAGGAPPSAAPHRVRVPVNMHRWDTISFLHWPFDPPVVARLVPDELTLLTWDGMAWVGLTPFVMRVRPPGVPFFPPGWQFPETNLRTYVAGPDGREGLWFLRMEVTAAWFVSTLRSLGLPYVRQRMSVDATDDRIVYRSRPRGASGGGHDVVVCPGELLAPPHGAALDLFMTARWGAYHRPGPMLYTPVDHPPWTLHNADVETWEVGAFFRDAGLPEPAQPPMAHFSPGVEVKVGRPRVV